MNLWDEVAGEADRQPIQTVRSLAAVAEEMHAGPGISSFLGIVMDLNGDYNFRRVGNRFAMIGMLTAALESLKDEMVPDLRGEDA